MSDKKKPINNTNDTTASRPHALKNPNWKAFTFPHGSYLLHIPSSHIIEVNQQLAKSVTDAKANILELEELEGTLPKAPEKKLEEISISAIALNVEESCNLRCTYCYAGDGNYGKDSSMTLKKAQDVLSSLVKDQPRFHIQFFGGEPLLNFQLIKDLVLWCEDSENFKQTKFSFSMTTNGVLLRDSIVQFLKEHRFSLTISYDGKSIQEKQRKTKEDKESSSFIRDKILKYKEELQGLASIKIRATISNACVSEAEAAMRDSIDNLGLTFAVSRAAEDKFGNSYQKEEIDQLIAALKNTVQHYLDKEDYQSLMRISKIKNFIKKLHHGRVNMNTCTAGLSYLSVSTSGEYYLCHRFTEDKNAKVGDYKSGVNLDKLKDIREHRLGKQEPCRSCWMRNWCGGGCYHENQLATGSKKEIDLDFCRIQDTEVKLAMKAYTQILKRKPEILENQ